LSVSSPHSRHMTPLWSTLSSLNNYGVRCQTELKRFYYYKIAKQ